MSELGKLALDRIKEIREKTGWSQPRIAKELGVCENSVWNWLNAIVEPRSAGRLKIEALYNKLFDANDTPPEAPENLDPIVKKYCEEDKKAVREVAENYIPKSSDLEPTSLEQLNPPDLSEINQKPISDGYARFLENLRYFMKDSRWDTDEKLETFLGVEPGYISSFGSHGDRFEELKIIGVICDLVGVPWSVLAFSNVAKEEQYARMRFKLQKMEEEMEALRVKAYALGSELGYISESNDEIPKS